MDGPDRRMPPPRCLPWWDGERWSCACGTTAPLETDADASNHYHSGRNPL